MTFYKKVKLTVLASIPYETDLDELKKYPFLCDLDIHEVEIDEVAEFVTDRERLVQVAKECGWELRDQFKPKEYR